MKEKKILRTNFEWMRYFGLLAIVLLAINPVISSAATNNVITNPGFESGTAPWVFYTNGAGNLLNNAPGSGSTSAGHITISSPGTNVQLFQAGIVLEPNTIYKLSFKAYSKTGHDISVSIAKHGSPYTNYGLSNFVSNLGTAWSDYSTQFTTSGFSGTVNDARLMFWLAPYAAAADQYFIDDVTIEKVSSSTPPPSSKSLLSNPGFETGTAPWAFFTNGAGKLLNDATGSSSAQAGHVTISQAGTNVQLYQAGIVLEPNTVYQLNYKAYSNTGHDLSVSIAKHGTPYTNYGLSNKVANIGTSWSDYSTQFTTSGFSGTVNDARLFFWLAPYAAAGDQYFIDDVILAKISGGTPVPPPTPISTPPTPITPPPAPISPPPPSSNKQLLLLDITYTHSTALTNNPWWGSGKSFSFFNLPSWIPTNFVEPTNYAGGTLYQRVQVITKPSSKPVQYQICLFQDSIIPSEHACSGGPTFTGVGTYYSSQPMNSLYQYYNLDWSRKLLVEMVVIKDKNGIPVDDRYGWDGQWDGSPDFSLYYPMQVRYTAIIVPSGGGTPVWT